MVIPSSIKSRLKPSRNQIKIIITLLIYTILICVLWNQKSLSWILWPFKIMTVALHELSHALMAICTKASVKKIVINPNQGGQTVYAGGNPYLIIPSGYIGSTLFGSLLIFCGFNQNTSKVASLIIMLCMGCTLFYSTGVFTFVFTIAVIIVVMMLLYIKKINIIQYFVLFIGIMSGLYSLWDIIEDLIKRRIESSDASRFANLPGMKWLSPELWGIIWLLFSIFTVFMSVIMALFIFNNNERRENEYQEEEYWELLPTFNSSTSNININNSNDDNFGFGVI
ncbi:hypothetical protein BCR36DRAFT_408660 [Piromyces finnis]|uniref:Peptidase M50B-like protein n=1 Tax=Piromyces finnis TaxID=1754191 RepID=A0A1Y1VLH4_9FUNG|nr:hypothetical protein BCR36DRAFT_408660 [Piromyces finnis]|eukprot:ORX59133.1 hypothetical protein BCR36DRAFT_408660 [Piromyces finnis]